MTMIDGVWQHEPDNRSGEFICEESVFRGWITADG
jgi:glutathionyl-hydroquinone reductase